MHNIALVATGCNVEDEEVSTLEEAGVELWRADRKEELGSI